MIDALPESFTAPLQASDIEISLAPNPVSSILHMRLSSPTESALTYRIVEMNGREIDSDKISAGESTSDIDVSYLVPAHYFLLVCDKRGQPVKAFKVSKVD